MKKLAFKGNSVEEKLAHAERLFGHMQSRMGTKVIGYLPGVPMTAYSPLPLEDGTLVSMVMPASGKVRKGVMVIKTYNTPNAVNFQFDLMRDKAGFHETFLTRKAIHIIDVEFKVEIGDIATIKAINPKTDGGKWIVENIWIGLMLDLDYDRGRMVEFMVDELEKIQDERIRSLTDSTE